VVADKGQIHFGQVSAIAMNIVPVENIPVLDEAALLWKEAESTVGVGDEWMPYTTLYQMFLEMKQMCVDLKGVGLSAVQVGESLPAFVANVGDKWRFFFKL